MAAHAAAAGSAASFPNRPTAAASHNLHSPPSAHRAPEKSAVQSLALAYWSFHYVKRLLETALVHK